MLDINVTKSLIVIMFEEDEYKVCACVRERERERETVRNCSLREKQRDWRWLFIRGCLKMSGWEWKLNVYIICIFNAPYVVKVRIYELYDVCIVRIWSTDSLGSTANFCEMFLGYLPYCEYLGTTIYQYCNMCIYCAFLRNNNSSISI